jgi:hypothetical protein
MHYKFTESKHKDGKDMEQKEEENEEFRTTHVRILVIHRLVRLLP